MSMLPFLKPRAISGAIVATKVRAPDNPESKAAEDKDNSNSGLLAGAQDLLRALQADDAKGVSEAFKAMFQILESQPHEEAPHTEE